MFRTLIASGALALASAASATSPIVYHLSDPPTATISTDDVNVHSVPGRLTVEHRIRMAARQVCVDSTDSSELFQPNSRFRNCYDLALSKAVSQLEQLASE